MPGGKHDPSLGTATAETGTANQADTAQGAPSRPVVALVLGLVAAMLGFINAWHVSMWVDEAYTISVATRSLGDVWRMVHNIDIVHSLYNVLLHPWLAVAGVSDVTVRLPSAVGVGVAAAGVYYLGCQLFTDRVAVTAALVFAILPRTTWMAIEGRSYAFTAAIAVWSSILVVTMVRRPTWARAIGYALAVGLGISLNIFLILLPAAHGLAILWDRRTRFSRAFWVFLLAGSSGLLLGSPVLLTALGQAAQIGPARLGPLGFVRSAFVNQWFLGDTPTISVSGGRILSGADGTQPWQIAAVLLAVLCWALISWGLWSARGRTLSAVPSALPFLAAWVVVPTAIMIGDAVLHTPVYNPRYLSFCTPAVALLVAVGISSLSTRLRILAIVLILASALPVYLSQRTEYAKSGADWQSIAAFVSDRKGPDQGVYFAPRSEPIPSGAEVATTTARVAAVLYPHAFAGIRDVTNAATPAETADLLGRSRSLADSMSALADVSTVFVIRRNDYPDNEVDAEDRLLNDAGFHQVDSWTGPLDTVLMYTS